MLLLMILSLNDLGDICVVNYSKKYLHIITSNQLGLDNLMMRRVACDFKRLG